MFNSPEFQALRQEYIEGAWERSRKLQATAAGLAAGESIDLRALRQEIHKLRGSGGFYGFKAITLTAGEAEDYLLGVLNDDQPLDRLKAVHLVESLVAACGEAARAAGLVTEG